MKKDVIYIDIEDDITAVIEKLKNSSEKIVALVPPKGNAVLQSVVNLKLLKRAAGNAGKQTVVVTSNHALTALAGGLGLYVAKNLQSKPVLPGADELEAAEEEVEVSDEAGEGLSEAGTSVPLSNTGNDSDEVELSGDELASLEADNQPAAGKAAKKPKKGSKKIPNFDTFRKKLLIGGGIALLLIVILLAVFGRSKATIVIRAETTPVDVAFEAKLNANSAKSDPETYNLKAISQENKKSLSQSFAATGQKDLGTKAGGNMTLSIPCSAVSGGPPTVPAGTGVSANGLTFITNSSVTLNSAAFSPCRFTGSTTVTAQNNGDQYNLSARNYSVSGYSSVTGSGSQMSGGTSRIVKVVSQEDVNKARTQLEQQDTTGIKDELKKNFPDNTTVFDDSFIATLTNIRSEPAVGAEANDAQLTAEVTYTMLGVSNDDLGAALDAFVTTEMTAKDQQRVYENGLKDATFEKVAGDGKTATYKVTTLGHYGPQFDTEQLKTDSAGKKFGEVRAYLQDLPGVKGVDIKLSPFWARKLPGTNRIDVKLDVDENSRG